MATAEIFKDSRSRAAFPRLREAWERGAYVLVMRMCADMDSWEAWSGVPSSGESRRRLVATISAARAKLRESE